MKVLILSSCDGTGYTETELFYTKNKNIDITYFVKACKFYFARVNENYSSYLSRGSEILFEASNIEDCIGRIHNFTDIDAYYKMHYQQD